MNTSTKNNNLLNKSTDVALSKSHDKIGVIKGGTKKKEKK